MADYELPPPPEVRTWSGRVFNVSTCYSSAGLSTSIFLDSRNGRIIMDCGDGCVRDSIEIERHFRNAGIDQAGRDLKKTGEAIMGVVISHPHYDHYSGLLTLLNFLQLLGRETPLPIFYPGGGSPIESIVDHFADHLWEEPLFDVDLVPLSPGDRIDLCGVGISCISSAHRHSRPGKVGGAVCALSFRFEMDGEAVTYTGDTGDISPIREFARGSSLLIVEATFDRPSPDSEGVHLTVDQAIELSRVAGGSLFVHFTAGSYKELSGRGLLGKK